VSGPGPGTREIRSLRPPMPGVDAWRPLGHRWDVERSSRIELRRALTVFLAGAECRFTCIFCDLWRHTVDGATPAGALPTQLEIALTAAREAVTPEAEDAIKLYNASNFFDPRAVPPADDAELARLCSGFARVTVETHARLLGERAERFAAMLDGRLEIAMGLETIHPTVFPRLNKGMDLEDFRASVSWAREREIGVRAFVLVGLPWVPAHEFAAWAVRSVEYAASIGVDRISLIPLRTGNGALDALSKSGDLGPVRIRHLEEAMRSSLERVRGSVVVEADVWDLDSFSTCELCLGQRAARLATANLKQEVAPPVDCGCAG